MKLKFGSKSQEFETDGTVKGTKVTLTNDDGAFYPVMLPADKIELSNAELEKLALEVVYQENFRDKFENEKFSEYDNTIKELKESYEIAEKMAKVATATLNDLINQMFADEESSNDTTTEN
ncbi:DUF1366 domain-containing protein [Streptococcus equinus]|uniref:DUF1366 domain-containing protein n=1 Tax=Streptococcus equinus TaxID=1335 RepID=A0A1G9KCW2_STREI|nr:DUF1366 domain-containing protein [Streptococcus equinus]QBX15809.1 hypothetical protein Javan215_0006 [Streptococcus phage Javan215]SDL47740.1 Protein of unknown function [Streptococcus equinus]